MKLTQALDKCKYILLAFLFYAILAYVFTLSFTNSIANSIMILLLFNSISKLKEYNIGTKIVAYLLIFAVSILFCADIFFRYEFKSGISFGVFSSIVETTLGESLSVMKDYVVSCLVILIIVFVVNCLVVKSLSISKIKGWQSLIALFPIYAFFIFFAFYRNGDKESIADNIKDQPLVGFHEYFANTFPLIIPEIVSGVVYYGEMSRLKSYTNSERTLPDGYVLDADNTTRPTKIYFVLGESSTRDHYSLYGYDKPTTPFLDSLSQGSDSLLVYYKAISPACLTRDAVRFALSFATPTDHLTPFYQYKSIIDMANDVNYKTIWISNQEKTGIFDSYIGCLVEQTQKDKFLEKTRQDPIGDDWNLLTLLPEFVQPQKQQFIVLHLQGSHENYNDRYTNQDKVIVNDEKLVESYDRTVHHTDLFLSKLYDFIKKEGDDAIVYYISDHGENTDEVPFGHGQMSGFGQYRIPMLTINYKSGVSTSQIMDKYVMNDLKVINSLSTISILAEIMGYKVSEEAINKDLNDSQYIYHVTSSAIEYPKDSL